MQRHDGRAPDVMRPVKITTNYLRHAAGSALIEFGDTHVLCAATIEDRVPPFPGVELVAGNRGKPRYLVDQETPIKDLFEAAQSHGEVTKFTIQPPRLSDLFREAVGQ